MAMYEMDYERAVLEALVCDVGTFFMDSAEQLNRSREGRVIVALSQLFVPEQESCTATDHYRLSAFCGGAAVGLASFAGSDLTSNNIERTMKHFYYRGIPIELVNPDADTAKSMFGVAAQAGLRSHPELRDHLDYTMGYFTETAKDPQFGVYASLGMGYVATRLDECFEIIRVRELFGVAPGSIDWDAGLRGLTGEQ